MCVKRYGLLVVALLIGGNAASAGPVGSLDDIQFWVGSGPNRAALAIDWFEGSAVDESLVWGYRWDGTKTAQDMYLDVVSADPRLFTKIGMFSFGMAIFGIGYDLNNDSTFAVTDGTVFGPNGIANSPGSDGETSLDPGDLYQEGFFLGFWHYANASGNPFAGGAWESSQVGLGDVVLADDTWHGLTFTATFDFTQFPQNPVAATIPEASSLLMVGLAGAVAFAWSRLRRAAYAVCFLAICAGVATAADPWADQVVSYTPGNPIGVGNPAPYQTNGSQALGAPTRDTGFGSQVGVFFGPFQSSEVVVIGAGGQLTVKFDEPVHNNAHNPFGIDLLIFGNAFFTRTAQGVVTGIASEPGVVEVSKDGSTWFTIPGALADGLFPTLGYQDTVYNGSANVGGAIPTDFTKPVDPSFNPIGKTESQINAGYAGSGGGLGVDIGLVGLDYIQYVRISQSSGDSWSTEIDALADVAAVPELSATTTVLLSSGVLGLLWFKRCD